MEATITDWRTLASNSETLNAADLQRDMTVKIESVVGGLFESDEEAGKKKKASKYALISFVGAHKKLGAKPLNCQLLEAMWGKDVEGWIGHYVTIGPDVVEEQMKGPLCGKPCVRVKGSPELTERRTVNIIMPQKRPFTRVLTPTPKMGGAPPLAGPGD